MYEVGKSALELESEQAERLQRKVDEERRLKEQGAAPEPVKRSRKKEEVDESTDNMDADIDYYPGQEDQPPKRSRKTTSLQSLLQPDTKEYRTTAADREERMKERQKTEMESTEVPDSTEHVEETQGAEAEAAETEKGRLERDIEEQQREIRRLREAKEA